MKGFNYVHCRFSVPNSRKNSPDADHTGSGNKITKFKQVLKPLRTIQKQSKISPYFPITSSNKKRTMDNSTQKKAVHSTIFSAQKHRPNITDLDLINKRLKTRNIRVHTLNQHKERIDSQSKHNTNVSCQKGLRNLCTRQHTQQSVLLTAFEQKQAKIYQVFFTGQRRIQADEDFTDSNGDPIVKVGDSVMFRYEILSELGRGAFGRVFKAYDHKRDELVALKIIKNHIKYQKQAKVEIKLLQQAILHDPKQKSNIVKLKHAFLFRGHPCLSFQLLHSNLYQFCENIKFTGLSLNLLRRFAIQILQCLYFLEKHHIIHCDLKPENIMIKRQNKTGIKIVDFGSGCFEGQQIYNYIQSRYYRAPEIALGVPYGMEIDMWSFGCVVVEMFIGVPLFAGQSQHDQLSLFTQVLGLPPKQLINRGNRSHLFFKQNQQLKPGNGIKQRSANSRPLEKVLKRCSDPQFVDFVKKILVWTPGQRLKASEALCHAWVLNGIPEQLKDQHLKIVQG